LTDSDDRSRSRDGRDIYLPPPPSSEEGPPESVKVPRVNPPSRALESYAREKPRRRPATSVDVWMALVVLIVLAAGLLYLFR
jgi:hypothetical protein